MNNLTKFRYRLLSRVTWGNKKRKYLQKLQNDESKEATLLRMIGEIEQKKLNLLTSRLDAIQARNDAVYNEMMNFNKNYWLAFEEKMRVHIAASAAHAQIFAPYKNCCAGKDAAIVATGPTLNFYRQMKNCVHIGCNKAFLSENVTLDYIFVQDYLFTKPYLDKLGDGKYKSVKKFYGILPQFAPDTLSAIQDVNIPEDTRLKHGAERYYITQEPCSNQKSIDFCLFTFDLAHAPFEDIGSTVFSAAQFAAWTRPARLFIVGCDCTSGHYDDNVFIHDLDFLIPRWAQFKRFMRTYYPDTEIVSVNPVGLKGMFRDVYTEAYLNEHPEIDRAAVEILKEKD